MRAGPVVILTVLLSGGFWKACLYFNQICLCRFCLKMVKALSISAFLSSTFSQKRKRKVRRKKEKKPGSECLLSDKFLISVEHFV